MPIFLAVEKCQSDLRSKLQLEVEAGIDRAREEWRSTEMARWKAEELEAELEKAREAWRSTELAEELSRAKDEWTRTTLSKDMTLEAKTFAEAKAKWERDELSLAIEKAREEVRGQIGIRSAQVRLLLCAPLYYSLFRCCLMTEDVSSLVLLFVNLLNSFIYLFFCSSVYSFICSLVHSSVHLLVRFFVYASFRSSISLYVHSFLHSFIRSIIRSFIHLFILLFSCYLSCVTFLMLPFLYDFSHVTFLMLPFL